MVLNVVLHTVSLIVPIIVIYIATKYRTIDYISGTTDTGFYKRIRMRMHNKKIVSCISHFNHPLCMGDTS